jgi:hypothetical protein
MDTTARNILSFTCRSAIHGCHRFGWATQLRRYFIVFHPTMLRVSSRIVAKKGSPLFKQLPLVSWMD